MSIPDAYEEFKRLNISEMPERKRRLVLPVPKHDVQLSIWNTLKSFIGKDLTRVAIPVHFNEPLTFLQRLSEDLEYSELLDQASEDGVSQSMKLMYIAVFSCIPYASTARRYSKPFNPLLAETYELVREDKGYACIAEQVSHHPPVTSMHTEHEKWSYWQEYAMDTKFRGLYFKVTPTGSVHFKIRGSGEHFSWCKPVTTIHNIIMGNLWNDQEGSICIMNHDTGEKALMHFSPYSKTKHFTKVKGEVFDKTGKVVINIEGDWESHYKYQMAGDNAWTDVWNIKKRTKDNLYYGFSEFAIQLNEDEEGVAPSDSRCRTDQRLLEKGQVDEAADDKFRLEELQRARRKDNNNAQPQWFEKKRDGDTRQVYWQYKGGYWDSKRDNTWDNVPDIY